MDPDKDNTKGRVMLVLFGTVCLVALMLIFEYCLMQEIVGGTGVVPCCNDVMVYNTLWIGISFVGVY